MTGRKKQRTGCAKATAGPLTAGERDALRKMTVSEKFRQMAALFDPRPRTAQELAEIEEVRARWKRLHDHYARSQNIP
jgi:hypothetical protein